MLKVVIILFTLVVVVTSKPRAKIRLFHNKPAVRNFHGVVTKAGEFPGQASLQLHGYHYCGGSILNADWVLTSAECVFGIPITRLSVMAGTNNLETGGSRHSVKEVIIHENFTEDKFHKNDIAVLKVDPPFKFRRGKLQAVSLPKNDHVQETDSHEATIIGWDGTGDHPSLLKKVDTKVINQENCKTMYLCGNRSLALDEGQICASTQGEHNGSCFGDTGGPLLVGGKVMGVLSWTVFKWGCSVPEFPLIHTGVVAHRTWIKEKTGV